MVGLTLSRNREDYVIQYVYIMWTYTQVSRLVISRLILDLLGLLSRISASKKWLNK